MSSSRLVELIPRMLVPLRASLHPITKLRKNMRNRLMLLEDKLLLRKRIIIESINDYLKNISQIEHTRHRSPRNFLVNLVCGLIAACHQPTKPSLHIDPDADLLALPAAYLIPNSRYSRLNGNG